MPSDESRLPGDVDRKLTPKFVYEEWRKTDGRRAKQRPKINRNKDAYESRMMSQGADDQKEEAGQILIEVSRMPSIIQTYTGYLFPRSPRTIFSPNVEGKGDPSKAQMATNRWFALRRSHKKMRRIIAQALLYPGGAIKIGQDLTKARPQDRVWATVVPWWDLVLDWDVQDDDEQRFMGHEYWEDVAILERRLGRKIPEDVPAEERVDYFDTRGGGDRRAASDRKTKSQSSVTRRFVRVLDWYNLIDEYETEGGKLQGRFEIYLVEQLKKDGAKPIFEGAMPFTHPDGSPCPPLVPCIFDSELEHPLRGIALADRVYDQCKELSLLRTAQANAVRRDARIMLVDKNAGISEDHLGQWVQGKDGAIIIVEKAKGMSWAQAVHVPTFGALSINYSTYGAAVEQDLTQGSNTPAFTRGEPAGSRTTATEIRQLNQYMENRFGELARIKDSWIADIARVFLRVMISAMKAPALLVNADKPSDDPNKKEPDVLVYFEGPKHERVAVTVENLDSEFDIGISDAASTPLTKELRKQDLISLMDRLLSLWEQASNGNAMAEAILENMVEMFDLPADFSPSALRAATEEGTQAAVADPKALMGALSKIPDEFWQGVLPQPGAPSGQPELPGQAVPPSLPPQEVM